MPPSQRLMHLSSLSELSLRSPPTTHPIWSALTQCHLQIWWRKQDHHTEHARQAPRTVEQLECLHTAFVQSPTIASWLDAAINKVIPIPTKKSLRKRSFRERYALKRIHVYPGS